MAKIKTSLRPSSSSSSFLKYKLFSSSTHLKKRPPTSNSRNEVLDIPSVADQTSLDKFLNEKCRSGNVSPHEAHYVFDCMIQRQPAPHMSSFSKLFTALVKNKHYDDVISHFKRINSTGFLPDLFTFSIFLNCL